MSQDNEQDPKELLYFREYWTGDSRDGRLEAGDGYHYFKMNADGLIIEAYEYYESDTAEEVISEIPEMRGVNWFKDLGYETFDEVLDPIEAWQFQEIKEKAPKRK